MSAGILFLQLITSLRKPKESYTGRTVIVTGSNIGLGFEAARHFTRLGATKVILAVRSPQKVQIAIKDIEKTTGDKNVVKVWQMDMSSYMHFSGKFKTFEKDESTITVDVVSTFLLALALLPKLKETSANSKRRISLMDKLNEHIKNMHERYFVLKMVAVLVIRAWADCKPVSHIPVTINLVNPGYCKFALTRNTSSAMKCGPESRGQYMSNCKRGRLLTQIRLWAGLSHKLEGSKPGITSNMEDLVNWHGFS
ncbi:NAD(P)-binding protein [Phaeosphaeriaceae sp. SRC1lsM3a]|nr:NAD(P)-binding protein [Stagonospora sp. SRC1lsM3a]